MIEGREMLSHGPVKFDLATGRRSEASFGAGRVGGEMVFVPRVDAQAEDDGYLMGFVHDERRGESELLIMEARTMSERPVARVAIPRRVPHGFHAAWVPDA